MDEGEEARHQLAAEHLLAAVELVTDQASWEALWKQMTAATTKAGDVAAHEEFRAVMAKKRRALA